MLTAPVLLLKENQQEGHVRPEDEDAEVKTWIYHSLR